jgi:hypothetical protein
VHEPLAPDGEPTGPPGQLMGDVLHCALLPMT